MWLASIYNLSQQSQGNKEIHVATLSSEEVVWAGSPLNLYWSEAPLEAIFKALKPFSSSCSTEVKKDKAKLGW